MLGFLIGRWSARRRGGYWTAGRVIACLLALGLAIVYWYVTLPVLAAVVLLGFVLGKRDLRAARRSTGRRTVKQPPPWPQSRVSDRR